uniref:CRK SH3-binding GNRP n=1 Tax=Leptobrachium leishanense TaxID=445787 RepID=A0A8C5QWJ1_9ANUR
PSGKPRSHLSSFTMKLKDKFHSPKIKRTPSKKGKPADLAVKTEEKPVNKTLSRLEEQEKEVVNALRYFKTIVDKMAVDKMVLVMLPGSASKVLEAILPLVQADTHSQQSTAISSCYSRVYQSLANLIRWSDKVMLEGVNSEDKEVVSTVKDVIKAVLDGVKELVRLMIEKQERPSPTSPVKPTLPACKTDSTTELPLSDRELEILSKSPESSAADVQVDCVETDETAPPKPPLPGIRVMENSPPPALPPKKRQSAPSPTRVAVVAPMSRATSGSSIPIGISAQDFEVDCYARRRLSGGSQSYGGESPRLSPCSSIGKLSKSDEQLSSLDRDSGQCSRNTSCETLDNYDPDYEFLQQDLSSADQVLGQGIGVLSPLPESLGESGSPFQGQTFQLPPGQTQHQDLTSLMVELPPALPEKKRRSAVSQTCDSPAGTRVCYERHPSQYDNISEDDLPPIAPSATPFAAVPPFQPGNVSQVEFLDDFAAIECDGISQSPPPLPEKKNKHMMTYMRFVEDYSEPQPSVFYQTPQNEHIYQQKNKHLREVYGFNDSFSGPDPAHERAPPPALPPKQRQLVSASHCRALTAPRYTNVLSQANLLCLDLNSSCSSVRGGTGHKMDLFIKCFSRKDTLRFLWFSFNLYVFFSSLTDLVLYCEAFLTTYRTFISPEELIQKLQFCHFQDTFKQRVSKNTFFVLVRVVDELCLVELTDEILKLLMELVFRLVCKGELSLARVLRKNILEKVENKRMLTHANYAHKPLAARGVAARPGTLHDFHSHEIAEQLTLLDAELFYKIEIPEVLLWAKEQNEEKSPNLTQFTEHFNNMSYWVRSIIMLQEKAQDRERLLLKFIKIMKHLRKLNNFNSYLAILSALDSAPIRRLEWQKQTSEGLAEYCTLIDSSSSFRAYRAALSEVEPPCIPYLGLILQDLTFVHLGNPDHIDGKVNFSKRWQQFNILDSMRRFQQVHYDVRRNDDIISFFNDFSDHLAEEALWELSLKIKPRNITRRKTERDEKT